MYESIRIQNFRGLKDLTIENLGRVNLLVGANNVGKTSVLEALRLLHIDHNPTEMVRMMSMRGLNPRQVTPSIAVAGFYYGVDDTSSAIISGLLVSGRTRTLVLEPVMQL